MKTTTVAAVRETSTQKTRSGGMVRRTMLATALALAGIGAFAANAVASTTNQSDMVKLADAVHQRTGDQVVGLLNSAQQMHIVVALKLRNRTALKSFIHAAQHHYAPLASRVLTHAQFMQRHAPTSNQAQAVANYLRRVGFSNVHISANRMLVSADAPAATVGAAFNTHFASVRTRHGRMAYANTSAVHIPSSLQGSVLSVVGLQNEFMAHTMISAAQPMAATQAVTGHNPADFSAIYGGTGVQTAAGVTVGIITSGSLTQTISDLNTFTSNNGLSTVTTQTVNTNGTSSDTSGVDEWNLDSQDIVGAAGGQVGKIIFYNIPSLSNSNLTADINTVVNANQAKIINVSLGECETDAQQDGSAAAQDQAFQQAVAQGQTFSVSTGDSGADECGDGGTTPSWPAASQYVMAVAGTTLNASSSNWNSETVWSSSGGSESTFEPKPSWQDSFYSGSYRGVADVAFDGDPNSGAQIIVNGSTTQVGGTSLSAPIFSGLWARVLAVKGTDFGFAAPLIYALPASDFHDITSGSNGGESAGAGYDLASGRGSLILANAINDIGGGSGGGTPSANFSYSVSGLSVNFTDSSTDSGGSISSYSWTFGDGSSSTSTNPSHTYAAAGTYNVTETVTDGTSGQSSSKTESVTVSSSGGGGSGQLLGNTGFESGSASPWSLSSGVLCSNSTCSGQSAHNGSWFAWLDGYGTSHTDTVSQQVAIPAGNSSATLSFYLHIDTSERTRRSAYDKMTVQVLNSSGSVLQTLHTYSNLDAASGYTKHSFDMSGYIGQTVTIKFTGSEDYSNQTSFVLDDITLNAQ